MNLSLLVADPFPVELWQRQDRFADVPSLALLLARGTCRTLPWRGAEAWAFETLTGRPATEAPLAALSLLADGGNPGDALWVRADPVHLALTRDSAILAPAGHLDIGADEAIELCGTLNEHFRDRGIVFRAPQPQRWYLELAAPVGALGDGPESSRGRRVANAPADRSSAPARALANEIQMVLHEHPVNAGRESAGRPPINSLWLWGEGRLPAPEVRGFDAVLSDLPVARGLSLSASLEHAPAGGASALFSRGDGRSALATAGPGADGEESLERRWFHPLYEAMRARRVKTARIVVAHVGARAALECSVAARDLWRIWRRAAPSLVAP